MKYRVVLWGLGIIYNRLLNTVRAYENKGSIEVVGVTSKDIPPYKRIDGYRIITPKEVTLTSFDYIIIMNEGSFADIFSFITVELGISDDRVLSYRMFQIPKLDITKYILLKQEKITILTNNCWGGMVYQFLGFECISPLRNCFMLDEDYLRFLSSPKEYLDDKPICCGFEKDVHTGHTYPVLEINGVRIHCNHETDANHAIDEWERRKRRVNMNNLFVEMYTENKEIESAFEKLIQYNKRVCFVPWETECKHSLQLVLLPNQKDFYETVNLNGGNGGWRYDLVSLLLTGEIKSRVEE